MNMVSDHVILHTLANRLERSVDNKDWVGVRALLHDIVVVDFGTADTLGGARRAAEKVVADLAAGHPDAEVTYHIRTNDIINVEAEAATLEGVQYAWSLSVDDPPDLYEFWGRMSYGFEKENGDWRVTALKSVKLREKRTPGIRGQPR